MRLLLPLLVVLGCSGCPVPVCDPTDTRCVSGVAEICGSDGVWRTLMDCVAEGMRCCDVEADLDAGIPSGHTCLPTCMDGGGDR